MPTISVIVPAFNEEKYIGDCLKSILSNRTPNVKEVIVVDNASTDHTADIARSFPGVTVITEQRKGLTRARQCALEHATGEVLAWADADCRVDAAWFRVLGDAFADDKARIVGLSGPYRYYDGPLIHRILTRISWPIISMPMSWISDGMIIGGNFAARRDALLKMGGFDTSIEFYGEDVDIAKRLRKIGKIRFTLRFVNRSSMRRFGSVGLMKTIALYIMNYFSIMIFGKAMTSTHQDAR